MALISRKGHVPHRSSKLTSVLRNTLGGNCKTVLVANVYGETRHLEETFSTLKFASRMQQVALRRPERAAAPAPSGSDLVRTRALVHIDRGTKRCVPRAPVAPSRR